MGQGEKELGSLNFGRLSEASVEILTLSLLSQVRLRN